MSMSWSPDGWAIDVDNPGYGEMIVAAPRHPFSGTPIVVEDWEKELKGPEIGSFLCQITSRAFDDQAPAPAAGEALPAFISPRAARTLLPALQQAVILATAGTDRYDRTFPDEDEAPAEPLCVRCQLGTFYTPGALPSEWCEQHGHTPFGMGSDTRWSTAQELYQIRRERWDRQREWNAKLAERRQKSREESQR